MTFRLMPADRKFARRELQWHRPVLQQRGCDRRAKQFRYQVWRNNTPLTNTPPTAPVSLTAIGIGGRLIFSWKAASDAQTPAAGLAYNLRVGTTPGATD